MPAGESAGDEFVGEPSAPRPPVPPETVPRERFTLPGSRGLRMRGRFWVATCGPTSRPWWALLCCLAGIAGLFLPLVRATGGEGRTAFELAAGPAVLALCLFAVLTMLPLVDLVLGRERVTPWLAFPAALGLQLTLALALVALSQGLDALHPRFSAGGTSLGVGALTLIAAEVALAVLGGFGFARRAARRTLGLR